MRYRSRGISCFLAVTLCSLAPVCSFKLVAENELPREYDYPRMFEYARELLSDRAVQVFLRDLFPKLRKVDEALAEKYGIEKKAFRDISETQLILILQHNTHLWDKLDQYLEEMRQASSPREKRKIQQRWANTFRDIHEDEDLTEKVRELTDPLSPLEIKTPDHSPAYDQLEVFLSHPYEYEGRTVRANDLRQVLLNFIEQAEREIDINVFDFDLTELESLLIKKHNEGVSVRIGIDDKVIEDNEETRRSYERFMAAGINVHAVDAVGLNHQKIATIDWSMPEKAKVLLSSGNFTTSGLHPEGDLAGHPDRPSHSLPNANNMVSLRSYYLANLVHHELEKTLGMGLRGRTELPFSGSFRFFGDTPEKQETQNSLTIAFGPNGALQNPNIHMINRMLRQIEGPLSIIQFAFSSETIVDAIFEYAKKELESGRDFDLQAIGDTPFSMVFWSAFLGLSGLEVTEANEDRSYVETLPNRWRDLLGNDAYKQLREQIRIAPPPYGHHWVETRDGGTLISSKIHHKLLVAGILSTFGSSANLSLASKTQSEQIVMIRDPQVAAIGHAATKHLMERSERSVYGEAMRRNRELLHDEVRERVSVDQPIELQPSRQSRLAQCYQALAETGSTVTP